MLEVSIVMPCLNEAKTLPICIKKARSFLDRLKIDGEIIVADNGSTDGSQDIAQRLGARVIHVPIRGYGAACLGGSRAAYGRYIIIGDADDSYDFSQLDAFVARFREGYDFVIGNRFEGGIAKGAMPWKNRYIGNPILSTIGKVLFESNVGDFHCGLRGITRESLDKLNLKTPGMEFASEMVALAERAGLRVANVPIKLDVDGRGRKSHLRPWRDGWRHLRLLSVVGAAGLLFWPGVALTVFGGAGVAATAFDDIHVGSIRLAIGSLLGFGLLLNSGLHLLMSGMMASLALAAPSDRKQRWPMSARRFLNMGTIAPVAAMGVVVAIVLAALAIQRWHSVEFGDLHTQNHVRLLALAFIFFGSGLVVFAGAIGLDAIAYAKEEAPHALQQPDVAMSDYDAARRSA